MKIAQLNTRSPARPMGWDINHKAFLATTKYVAKTGKGAFTCHGIRVALCLRLNPRSFQA